MSMCAKLFCKGSDSVSLFLSLIATSEISVFFISYHKQRTRLCSLVTPERELIQLGSFSSDLLLFLEFKQILELGLDRLLHQLYGIQPFVVLGQLHT